MRARSGGLPTVVLMLGEPGSGKTRLGTELARYLRVPFLAKDDVRGGLYFTRGAWGDRPTPPPSRAEAGDVFLTVVERLAGSGVSCVVEHVFRSERPEELQRITSVARCVGIVARCEDPSGRRIARDLAEPLLRRQPVLEAAGAASVDELVARSEARMRRVAAEMLQTFELPLLTVDTDDGWSPPLDQVADFVATSASAGR